MICVRIPVLRTSCGASAWRPKLVSSKIGVKETMSANATLPTTIAPSYTYERGIGKSRCVRDSTHPDRECIAAATHCHCHGREWGKCECVVAERRARVMATDAGYGPALRIASGR